MLREENIQGVYQNHEVACHGHMHLALPTLDSVETIRELLICREGLEKLLGRPVVGYAYAIGPYNAESEGYLKMCGLAYARTTESTGVFDLPQNFYYWHPTCHHQDPQLFELAERFLQKPTIPFLKKRLFYVWGHSYEFDAEHNWDRIESLFKMVGQRDDIWYATNGDIAFYAEAFKRLIFSADNRFVYNPSCLDVWVEINGAAICAAAGTLVVLKEK